MNTVKYYFKSERHSAVALCFAGFYVGSLGAVIVMIEGTQALLGLI